MLYMVTGELAHLGCYFVIPNGRIRLIQLLLGVLVLVSKFRLLGELTCGHIQHCTPDDG